jgi:predicted transcriptional regulator
MPTITLRIPDATNAALDALAEATDRSKSYLALRAIDEYLKLNAWQIDAIRSGIADAEAGKLIEHEDVKRRWKAKLEDPR